jgi:hypothetical protein
MMLVSLYNRQDIELLSTRNLIILSNYGQFRTVSSILQPSSDFRAYLYRMLVPYFNHHRHSFSKFLFRNFQMLVQSIFKCSQIDS